MPPRVVKRNTPVVAKRVWAEPVWLKPLLMGAAAILLLSLFTGEIRDTDIWLHLKTGQHTLETRALTAPDPFSYTSLGISANYPSEEVTRYFNLTHEWLAQIGMYLIYSVSGFAGLVLARALLLIAFCALVGWMGYRRAGNFYIGLAAALAAAGVAVNFQQSRPFLVTFVGLAVTMALMESGRSLWLLPPMFLIWANCHAGFFMGWLVLGAYCADALIERLRKRPVAGERRMWLVAIACVLASALNPNGFRVLQILFLYRKSGIQSDNLEWQKPIFWEPSMFSVLLFGSILALLFAYRRARVVDWLLCFGFAAISLMAIRNVIFMGLVGPVIIAAYLPRWRWVPVASTAAAAASLLAVNVPPALATNNSFAFRAAEWQLPSGAADFIQKHQIGARMFNSYESGGYLVWRLWPLQRDFIDPRGLSEDAYADYKRILMNTDSSGKKGAEPLLQKYGIRTLVIEGFDYLSGQVYPLAVELSQSPQAAWKLVYSDSKSLVLMRDPSADVIPQDAAALTQSLEQQCEEHLRHEPWRPRCARGLGELYAFQGNIAKATQWVSYYLDHRTEPDPEAQLMSQSLRVTALNNQAVSLEAAGDATGAENLLRSALTIATTSLGPDHADTAGTLNNLAQLLESKGDYDDAEPLYRRALAIAEKTLGPNHPNTATSLDNLAGLLASKGDYAEAEPMFGRALAIAEKTLGPNDPTTQGIRENLDALLKRRPK